MNINNDDINLQYGENNELGKAPNDINQKESSDEHTQR
jgi:hypothetical protein